MSTIYGPDPTGVDWHQFGLAEPGLLRSLSPGGLTNGLITAAPEGGAIVHTGIATGDVAVSVELRDEAAPPGVPSWREWEEIAEITVQAPTGQLRVWALMADAPGLPLLTTHGAGPYRVRVHARGRDIAYDLALIDEIVEDYLIQVWPAPPAPELIHKQTDKCGAGLRRSAALNAARMANQHLDRTERR